MAEASAEAACAAAAVASGESPGLLCNSSLTALSADVTSPALHYTPALSYSSILRYQGLYATNMHGSDVRRSVSPMHGIRKVCLRFTQVRHGEM